MYNKLKIIQSIKLQLVIEQNIKWGISHDSKEWKWDMHMTLCFPSLWGADSC